MTFSSVAEKTGGCRCRELAVVERFKQEVMYGLSAGTEKSRRCEEVAVSRGSTVNFTQIEGHNSAYIVQSTLSKTDAFGTGTKCPS